MLKSKQILRIGLLFLATWLPTVTPEFGWSHARLNNPIPRSNDDGLKSPAPCGGIPPKKSAEFDMGSAIELKWTETINHPGQFDFALINEGNNSKTPLGSYVKKDSENNKNVPHSYSMAVKLPDGYVCENCILQMIQVMKENPSNPSYYYSCADIQIKTPQNPTTPGPTPTPSPPPPSPDTNSPQNTKIESEPVRPIRFASNCGSLTLQTQNSSSAISLGTVSPIEILLKVLLMILPLLVILFLRTDPS